VTAIETEGLTKRFRHVVAVDGVSLTVPTGARYGLLGPNGSGKTTLVRMLLGLVHPTEGRVALLGRPIPRDAAHVLPRVGALVEGPAAWPHLSGRTNLRLLDAAGKSGRRDRADRVEEALARVGLGGIDRRPVRTYSLGMRQRLGIAAALIGDPSVLILDEPANGLDPAGIRWMRDLLRDYADQGGTVLLSSHLLSEVEIIADDIVMIGQGRIVCQGSKAELLQAAGTVVRAADVAALQRALTAAGVVSTVSQDGSLRTEADPASVGRAAYDGGVMLTELRTAESGGLEEMFLELTADTQRERTAA